MKSDRSKDRPAMLTLVDTLATRPQLLRRDECGDWNLFGKAGHVYAIPEANAYYFMVRCRSSKTWNHLKRRLSFCTLTQDGDDEGVFRLSGLPNETQAGLLRTALGLPLRRRLSPEHCAKLVAHAKPFKPKALRL